MKEIKRMCCVACFCLWVACANESPSKALFKNPPAEGFNVEQSDPKAIRIANQVMEAMGGRSAYDNTRFMEWNFFGSRKHCWDKQTGNVRIESEKDNYTIIMNINEMTGSIKKDDVILSHPDSVHKYLQRGKEMWINDSYWLVMPYKLKDTGVTLKYVAEEVTDSTHYDVLSLTFEQVGVTPENKYHVFVDHSSNLIKKWSFFDKASDTVPRFSTPWADYKKHGNILLSSNRGNYDLTEISVSEDIEQSMFSEL